ncbi:hypothetical protein LGR54_13000 [Ancylobacter sp. Lp-2]|uniref:hypothetical protein n=1 Tax=Ancylobacter sp. Lp-2 TaxID=2881339 RepID=UPI001E47B7A7|nr:hypothetical protein [Ancylobacter sp. Lp-2]MCB4769529.1 hypothetical protein [Ancylobacter sp. Lp-2]
MDHPLLALRRIALARLIAALIALAFTLTGPVTAAQAMGAQIGMTSRIDNAAGAMPCHEGAAAQAEAALAKVPVAKVSYAADAVATVAPHDGGAALSHLCCVLTCLMVPPLAASQLVVPLAVAAPLAAGPALPLSGTGLARPDPPPRHA